MIQYTGDGARYCFSPDYNYEPGNITVPIKKEDGDDVFYDFDLAIPEQCELFAADLDGEKVTVPFDGTSGENHNEIR